jgi:hypothetical protein
MKRKSAQNADAITRLAKIEASIAGLEDDDLIDLADIFLEKPDTDIALYASAEMARRKISL